MFTFGEVHSFSLDGMSYDHRWLIGVSRRFGAFESRDNLRKVMPINLKATPA